MSSAYYPLGMNTYNNRLPQGGYKTWKGRGAFSNPVGITSGNQRPLTNNDPANDAVYKFGLPRPIKLYRRGISIPVPVMKENPQNPGEMVETYYYSNREVKSSVQDKMVAQMQDQPGRFIVKENTITGNENNLEKDCRTCNGVGIVSSWFPINNLTEKPQANVTNPLLCCNQQRKARQRVLPTSTLLKKNYFQTTYMYLFNRCQTFVQREFNFVRNKGMTEQEYLEIVKKYPFLKESALLLSKPGDPLSYLNYYVANCNPNSLIDTTSLVVEINVIVKTLYNKGILDNNDIENYKKIKIGSFGDFEKFILDLPEDKKRVAILAIIDILTNTNNLSLLEGPSNPKGCARVYYKPNNPQYAQQGAVSSSTRILKLNVTTIEKNAASISNNNRSVNNAPNLPNMISNGENVVNPNIYKNKAPRCNPGIYTFNGNPKTCFRNTNDISGPMNTIYL